MQQVKEHSAQTVEGSGKGSYSQRSWHGIDSSHVHYNV